MNYPNIALVGNMYAGKSTIAETLASDLGYVRMAFAAPLKNVAALAYGTIDKGGKYETTLDVHPVNPAPDQQLIKSGREILQQVGQAMKAVDRDFWIKCFQREAARYDNVPLVVDDLRFLFERDMLREAGWFIVGVNTPEQVRMDRALRITGRVPTEAELNHESEREVQQIIEQADYVVLGDGDPYKQVAFMMEQWNKRAYSPNR
jgi:dephospho-CoA kinase